MKIAIISDIHDNLVNLEKCLDWCREEKIKHFICCGDITNSETLNLLATEFNGQIYLVEGNIEIYNKVEVKRYDNIQYFDKIGKVKLGSKTIGICHEPYLLDRVIEGGDCDIIFYGHTHKPWSSFAKVTDDKSSYPAKLAGSDDKEVLTVNPGTLGGMFAKSTFAIYNTENEEVELKLLELL